MKLSQQEHATILAALRNLQETTDENSRASFPHFIDVEPLSDDQIDELCERLNCEEDTDTGNVLALSNAIKALVLEDDVDFEGDLDTWPIVEFYRCRHCWKVYENETKVCISDICPANIARLAVKNAAV